MDGTALEGSNTVGVIAKEGKSMKTGKTSSTRFKSVKWAK